MDIDIYNKLIASAASGDDCILHSWEAEAIRRMLATTWDLQQRIDQLECELDTALWSRLEG